MDTFKFVDGAQSFIQGIGTVKEVAISCYNSIKIADKIQCAFKTMLRIYEIDDDLIHFLSLTISFKPFGF